MYESYIHLQHHMSEEAVPAMWCFPNMDNVLLTILYITRSHNISALCHLSPLSGATALSHQSHYIIWLCFQDWLLLLQLFAQLLCQGSARQGTALTSELWPTACSALPGHVGIWAGPTSTPTCQTHTPQDRAPLSRRKITVFSNLSLTQMSAIHLFMKGRGVKCQVMVFKTNCLQCLSRNESLW